MSKVKQSSKGPTAVFVLFLLLLDKKVNLAYNKPTSRWDGSFSGGNRFTLFEASKILVRLTGAFCVAETRELARKTLFSARFAAV